MPTQQQSINRRDFVRYAAGAVGGAVAVAGSYGCPHAGAAEAKVTHAARARKDQVAGIVLNEDDSHFFYSRSPDEMTLKGVHEYVDNRAGPQVTEIFYNPNAQRTSYASKAWQSHWDGRQVKPGENGSLPKWMNNAHLLHSRGIDPYAVWLSRAREKGISPWVSMRMNDIHCGYDEKSPLHSDFWVQHKDLRRVRHRHPLCSREAAFDYGRKEVREHHMALVRELLARYDTDGIELDWMRFPKHFQLGHEQQGGRVLTKEFMPEVRRLANKAAKRLGHPVKVAVRVPSRPQMARELGMDAIAWARRGLVDMITVTPFLYTLEFDMPIELWRELLGNLPICLAAGLEWGLTPYWEARLVGDMRNTAETVCGAAASYLHRGADRIYLFNYFDRQPEPEDEASIKEMLAHAGSAETATAHPRRHVVTFIDTASPGARRLQVLPSKVFFGWEGNATFRINIGPRPTGRRVTAFVGLGKDGCQDFSGLEVFCNSAPCPPTEAAAPKVHPVVNKVMGFDVSASCLQGGDNILDLAARKPEVITKPKPENTYQVVWVEIRITA